MTELAPAPILIEETVALADLKPHPRNYRQHPQDQLDHLKVSITKHGMYRNVVIARDGTILAGHGVVEAARQLGLTDVPARRVDIEPENVLALEILAADNEIDHLAVVDDRALTELLKEIKDTDFDGLLGTGYDDAMLANLAFVTRPKSEIRDFDAAAAWVGMPEYESDTAPRTELTMIFDSDDDRARFVDEYGIENIYRKTPEAWSSRWPWREKEDRQATRFEADGA